MLFCLFQLIFQSNVFNVHFFAPARCQSTILAGYWCQHAYFPNTRVRTWAQCRCPGPRCRFCTRTLMVLESLEYLLSEPDSILWRCQVTSQSVTKCEQNLPHLLDRQQNVCCVFLYQDQSACSKYYTRLLIINIYGFFFAFFSST